MFERFFSPWFEEQDRPKMTRPDMFQLPAYEGKPLILDDIQYLDPEYLEHQQRYLNDTMVNAILEDFRHITNSDKLDIAALAALDVSGHHKIRNAKIYF